MVTVSVPIGRKTRFRCTFRGFDRSRLNFRNMFMYIMKRVSSLHASLDNLCAYLNGSVNPFDLLKIKTFYDFVRNELCSDDEENL